MTDHLTPIDLNLAVQLLRGQLQQARRELAKQTMDASGEQVRFLVNDIELELQVALSHVDETQTGGKVGLKWVVCAEGSVGSKQAVQNVATHVVRLKLTPRVCTPAGEQEMEIGDRAGADELDMEVVD